MSRKESNRQRAGFFLTEDWLSVLLAFLLILLSVIGVLGKNGINITF
jgi:hypothetical protein